MDTLSRKNPEEIVYSAVLLRKVRSVAKSTRTTRLLSASDLTELASIHGGVCATALVEGKIKSLGWFMFRGAQLAVSTRENGSRALYRL